MLTCEAAVEPGADAGGGAELGAVGAVHRVELIVQVGDDVAEDADAELAPRRGNDQFVDGGAVDAVERGRLVEDVDDAERHQDEADADADGHALPRLELEVRLLDLELVDVLDLELGVDADPVGEAVAEEEDDAAQGQPRVVALEDEVGLAVGADGDAASGAEVERGRARRVEHLLRRRDLERHVGLGRQRHRRPARRRRDRLAPASRAPLRRRQRRRRRRLLRRVVGLRRLVQRHQRPLHGRSAPRRRHDQRHHRHQPHADHCAAPGWSSGLKT